MFGRLDFSAIPTNPVTIGGAIGMIIAGLTIVILITKYKKWKWLWNNWITSLDPKKIGIMYIVAATIMLLRGFADVLMLRVQQALLANTEINIISADFFQQVFSAHGTIMIFFVAMGVVFGLINLIVPLQIGARDVAFPLLNSISFWLFTAGMIIMNLSLMIGEFSSAGWLAYPPLSGLEYNPGVGVDYWIWSLQLSGVGSLLTGINYIVTILLYRRKGMTLMKMPIFVWSVLGSLTLIVWAFPILTATLGLLTLDRTIGTHFFTSDLGGNPMTYINLIWAWGHPEVYILILPAFGIFSEIVPVFSRKKLFGYNSMVIALILITILSFTVWLHHFFTMGSGANVNSFFGIMTMIIAIPTGVKVFNWIFTMYKGKITFATPMLWFLGFVATFTIGGLTGVMLSVPGIDFQVHNSLFLVAHFHNMIIGGVLFGAFAGLTYWWPRFTGFYLNEKIGKIAFWFWLTGFIVAFVPLYVLGLMGAVRRLDGYDPSLGWQSLFIVAGIGVLLIGVGIIMQIFQIIYSAVNRNRQLAPFDAWNGRTLEWSVKFPIPEYNFSRLTKIKNRDDFWYSKQVSSRHVPKEAVEDITILNNSNVGFFVGIASVVFAFSIVWHIWWLSILGLLTLIILVVFITQKDVKMKYFKAREILKIEGK